MEGQPLADPFGNVVARFSVSRFPELIGAFERTLEATRRGVNDCRRPQHVGAHVLRLIHSFDCPQRHADVAREVVNRFLTMLRAKYPLRVEQPLSSQGGRLTVTVARQ